MAFLKTRVATFYDKEILKYVTGIEATKNVVIDSTSVPVDSSSGRYVLQAGTLLVKASLNSPANASQTVGVVFGSAGEYKLRMQEPAGGAGGTGVTSVINAATTTAAELQTKLEELPEVGAGNVAVTLAVGKASGPAEPRQYTITFQGRLAQLPVSPLEAVESTVNNSGVTVATVAAGLTSTGPVGKVAPAASSGVSASNIVGILTHTVEFFYPVEPDITDEPAAAYFHLCIFDSTKLINVEGNLAEVQKALPTCKFE